MEPLRVDDYAELAQTALSDDIWGYIRGGGGVEWTIAENRAAFERVTLRPRVLVDVSRCDTSTTLLGRNLPTPIGVAPMAYQRLAHPDGELATASAAAGALFVVSIFATTPLADIAARASGPLWLQLYWLRRRDAVVSMIRKAEDAGFEAFVLTVDTPKVARRLRDIGNSFTLPTDVRAVNLDAEDISEAHAGDGAGSALERHSVQRFDQTITWRDLAWLREQTTLPLLIKGILTEEDTKLSVEHGLDGIIVSNHGGRQLDGVPAAVTALPEVVSAAGNLPVLLDGGVRSGTDVFRALALGARAVLVGRPVLWGLASGGADGATNVLRLLNDELVDCMTLSGRPVIADIDASSVSAPLPPR